MKKIILLLIGGILLTGCSDEAEESQSASDQVNLVWELGGLNNPESAVYNPASDSLFVSNVNGSPVEHDGNGYISQVALDGTFIAKRWFIGLDAPKGLAIDGGTLYVADIDRLLAIDLNSATISAVYPVSDAKFLNDVAVGKDGAVYVSDMMLDRIHRLHNGTFQIWLESSDLESPNGLHAEDERLILGAWGKMAEDFSTEVAGHLKAISLSDQSITSLGDNTPVGNLDGVEADGLGGYYVTDWMAGKLYQFSKTGKFKLLLELTQGMADHEVLLDKRWIVLPMMNDNKMVVYEF